MPCKKILSNCQVSRYVVSTTQCQKMDFELWIKVFLYYFDVVSDFLNGITLVTKEIALSNTTTLTITVPKSFTVSTNDTFFSVKTRNDSFSVESFQCQGNNKDFPLILSYCGPMTIGFQWLPALLAVLRLLVEIATNARAKQWRKMLLKLFLLPIRFILWPFLVPIRM